LGRAYRTFFILRLDLHEVVKLVGFADDIAMVITAPNVDLLENIGNAALDLVSRWIRENGLQMAPQKSEAVVLTIKWVFRNSNFSLGGHQISVKSGVRSWEVNAKHSGAISV